MTGERALPFRLAAGEGRCCHTDAGAALEALKARLARALWVAFEFSSEKVRGRTEQRELALATSTSCWLRPSLTDNAVGTAAKDELPAEQSANRAAVRCRRCRQES